MPPLGWIHPNDRTPAQQAAHAAAVATRPRFAIQGAQRQLAKGDKIILTDFWKRPECVADMGQEFTGFHQLTGSCVGASAGNAVCTLSCVQRTLASGATKAFIPWWPFAYGRTRSNEGDSGQGEGAVDSVMGQTLHGEGTFDISQAGLPKFQTDDGFYLTESLEMQWSDGARIEQKWRDLAKQFPVGTVATLSDSQGIWDAILNGYPVLDGCENYVGNGRIVGSGADAYVQGHYDGQGGHSTCILGIWEHPSDGQLFLYSNQWPSSTYPKDPAGAGRCCVWITKSEMDKLFRTGGGDGETVALSHLSYFPAQPTLLHYAY